MPDHFSLHLSASSIIHGKQILKQMKKDKKKYYAIGVGRRLGVFGTWGECKALVDGYPGARFKSFLVKTDAIAWLSGGINKPIVNSGHRGDMRGYADDSHCPVKTIRGELYFEISCDCLPWVGCMKCIPVVEARWGVNPVEAFNPRQLEMGYIYTDLQISYIESNMIASTT